MNVSEKLNFKNGSKQRFCQFYRSTEGFHELQSQTPALRILCDSGPGTRWMYLCLGLRDGCWDAVKGNQSAGRTEEKPGAGADHYTTRPGSPLGLPRQATGAHLPPPEAEQPGWQVQTHSPWHGICHQMAPL